MKRKMAIFSFFSFMLFCLGTISAFAQDNVIKGTVVDEAKIGIPGVSVFFKNSTVGTATDFDGNFELKKEDGNHILIFSFIGMETQEVDISGKSSIEVIMKSDAVGLEEVVAIGYGVQKKRDLIGSISSVKSEKLLSLAAPRSDQMLQGKVAGVQISNASAHPGGNVTMRVRGTSSLYGDSEPLVIVDGVIGASMEQINPNDIESMEVLKDASSTAIYGSRGANGVILVTTKRGKKGGTKVSYSGYYGVQSVRNKFDLLSASEHAELVNYAVDNTELDESFRQPTNLGTGTDWQDEIYRSAAITNHNININGGSEKTQFALSLDYFNQDGVIKKSSFERASARINLDHKINDKLKIGANFYYSRSGQNLVRMNTRGGSNGGAVTAAALSYSPIVTPFDENGEYSLPLDPASQTNNPLAILNETTNKLTKNYFQGSVFGNLEIVSGLNLNTRFSYKLQDDDKKYFRGAVLLGADGGTAEIKNTESTDWLSETTLSYNKTINEKHKIGLLGGFTLQEEKYFMSFMRSKNFPTETNKYNQIELGNPETFELDSDDTKRTIASTIARFNYTYADKYLLTASARYDGASVFGENNKHALFPSVALGWRVSEEPFFDLPEVSSMKVRASIGEVGNQAIPTYKTFASSSVASANNSYSYNGTSASNSVQLKRLSNPDLTWETTRQFNVGVDLHLFDGRIEFIADYYKKTTFDLLFERPLPLVAGVSTTLDNIGEVENKGYELQLSTINLDGEFHWSTDFNISINQNKVLDLGESDEVQLNPEFNNLGEGSVRLIKGEEVGTFYGYVFDGVYQNQAEADALPFSGNTPEPGDAKYKDLNGDGEITDEDKTIIGTPVPNMILGLNNTFKYKNFDLNVFVTGSFGNDVVNGTRFLLDNGEKPMTNKTKDFYNSYWKGEGTSNTTPALLGYNTFSSYYVEDGSYIRLQNVTLGYNLPESLLGKLNINQARFYVSAQNLFVITDYTGYDPEVNSKGDLSAESGGNLIQGIDYGSFPTAKTISVGVKVIF